MNVAIYMRLSKEDELIRDESNSITSQRMMLLKYIRNHEELKSCKVLQFLDDGFSGTNLDRPGMQDMLGQVKAGLINCIIVKDFSRFARNHIDLGKHIEQIFPFMGVRFIAINDDYDSKNTDGGISGLGDQFKMLFYDLYSKDLSQKVKSSMVALKKQGKFVGGFAPFGYRKASDDKSKLLIDEEAAAVVRRIFHLALDEMSMYQICQVLNNESVPTPAVYMNEKFGRRDAHVEKNQNQYWTVGKIKRILDNEVYTGTLVAGKARAASVGSKKRVHIDEEDWIRVADTQEAIISREIFEKAQELRAKGFFFGTKKHESHVLCGKVICGSCGRNMAHSYQGIPKFLCNNKYFSPDAKNSKDLKECKCVDSIHDKDLEGIVIGAIEDAAARATDTVRIREKSSLQLFIKRKEIGNEISKLTANIARSDEVLMKKYEEYLEGKLSREEYQDQRRKIDNDNAGIQDQEQQLQERLDSDTSLQAKRITGLDLLEDCVKVEELTQELVDSLVEKVVVKNGKEVEVRLKVRV